MEEQQLHSIRVWNHDDPLGYDLTDDLKYMTDNDIFHATATTQLITSYVFKSVLVNGGHFEH